MALNILYKRKFLLSFLYLFIILSVAIYAYKKPYNNWDTLPYMGVVLSYENDNPKFIHDTVFEIAKKQMPAETYWQITDTAMEYKKRMLQNENEFYNLLPFYVIKPLYTGLIYLCYKSGFSILKATILPSVIAYIFTGILLFKWLEKYAQLLFTFLACTLFMLSGPMLDVVKTSSPDCLASFLLLSAFYCLIEGKSLLFVFIFLILSIFARLDNFIPTVFILSLLAFTNKWKEKIPLKKFFVMISIAIIAYFLITSLALKFGWSLLYYPSFATHLNISYNANTVFSFKDYFSLFYTHVISSFFYSYFILFLFLALIVFIDKFPFKFKQLTFEQLLLLTIFLSIGVRFILQPLIADRFFIAYYLCIIVLLIKKYSQLAALISFPSQQ